MDELASMVVVGRRCKEREGEVNERVAERGDRGLWLPFAGRRTGYIGRGESGDGEETGWTV